MRHLTMPTAFIVAPRSGIGLGHELAELLGTGIDHAEAALRHEVGVILARDDLPDRGGTACRALRAAGSSAPQCRAMRPSSSCCPSLPSASERSDTSCDGLSAMTARLFTLPASMSDRASGSEHRRDLHAAGDEILQSWRGAVRRYPRHGRRIHFEILQHAGQRQMPDAALPGAGRLHLARIGLDRRDQVVDGLVRRDRLRPRRRRGRR